MKKVLTKKGLDRQRRDEAICAEFSSLMARGSMKTPTYQRLAKKYGLSAYTISKVVKGRGKA